MLSDKKLEKIEKTLTDTVVNELKVLTEQEIKERIIGSETSIKKAVEELEANEQYQALKESLKDMSAGLRDVKKYQKAVIDYCLHLLEGESS